MTTQAKFDALGAEMHSEFDELRREIRSLRTLVIAGGGALWASWVGGLIAVIVSL